MEKVKQERNVTGPFRPKLPNLFTPLIRERMGEIVFASYKRSPNPNPLPPPPLSLVLLSAHPPAPSPSSSPRLSLLRFVAHGATATFLPP
jgi:hypothetical protein